MVPNGWSSDLPDSDLPHSPTNNPQLVQDFDAPLDKEVVSDVVDDVASELTLNQEGCAHEELETRNKPLMSLLKYPEFRFQTVSKVIKIGCVKLRIWYPQLFYRQTTLVLFAFSRLNYKAAGDLLGESLEDCAIDAFITGGIAGIVTGNFGAAVAVFEFSFKECVKRKLAALLKCLVAGLFIGKERGGWKKV